MNHLSVTQWQRICAADISREQVTATLETTSAEHKTAKQTMTDREAGLLAAIKECRESSSGSISADDWKRISKLQEDVERAIKEFELVDRNRRRLVDQVGKLTSAELQLVHDARESEDLFTQKSAKGSEDAWKSICVADIVGPMYGEPFVKLGIRTVEELIAAYEDERLEGHVNDGELTQPQVDHATGSVYLVINQLKIADKLPPTWKTDQVLPPEAPKAPKAEKSDKKEGGDLPSGEAGESEDGDGETDGDGSPQPAGLDPVEAAASSLTEADAQTITGYKGVKNPKNGIDPQEWPREGFDSLPFADQALHPLKLVADGGFYIDHFGDLARYLRVRGAGTPMALMQRVIANVAASKRPFDANGTDDAIDGRIGKWALERVCRLHAAWAMHGSTRIAEFLQWASDGDNIGQIRTVSPFVAALAERQREINGQGDGTAAAPKGPQGGSSGSARRRSEAAERKHRGAAKKGASGGGGGGGGKGGSKQKSKPKGGRR